MLKYIIKRVLIFIPTLFIITLLGFVISFNAPGDPVDKMLSAAGSDDASNSKISTRIEQKKFWRKKLGLDLPVFYFSLSSLSYPDSLYKIDDKNEKEALSRLIDKYGNWQYIHEYNKLIHQFEAQFIQLIADSAFLSLLKNQGNFEQVTETRFEILSLKYNHDEYLFQLKTTKIRQCITQYFNGHVTIINLLHQLEKKHLELTLNKCTWKNYIPWIHFYGTKNQYHRWLFGDGEYSRGLIRLDFGISYLTQQPVNTVIFNKIGWTLFFSLSSVLLSYIISIFIGLQITRYKGTFLEKTTSLSLFVIYSLPAFFFSVLLLMLFANPDVWNIFPSSGIKPVGGYPEGSGIMDKIKLSLPYIVLPLICYTYSSVTFISRMITGSMSEAMQQDYIRTARAKGLSEKKVIYKHAFRNSLLPLITILANVFPAAIGGSVVLETVFTIPGMGYESYLAIQLQNYPIIIAVFTLTGMLTLLGFLLSDILYTLADPRISLK